MKLNIAQKSPGQCAEFLNVGIRGMRGLSNLLQCAGHEDISKSARFAILNRRGEMAERLKAAVC